MVLRTRKKANLYTWLFLLQCGSGDTVISPPPPNRFLSCVEVLLPLIPHTPCCFRRTLGTVQLQTIDCFEVLLLLSGHTPAPAQVPSEPEIACVFGWKLFPIEGGTCHSLPAFLPTCLLLSYSLPQYCALSTLKYWIQYASRGLDLYLNADWSPCFPPKQLHISHSHFNGTTKILPVPPRQVRI